MNPGTRERLETIAQRMNEGERVEPAPEKSGLSLQLVVARFWAAKRCSSHTATTNAAQAPSDTASSRGSGGKTSTNPLPLMSCEKLDTQKGMRNSRNVVQRSGGGLPGSRTDR